MDIILSQRKQLDTMVDPITKKYQLRLAPPSLQDNRGDADRLREAVVEHCGGHLFIPLSLLKDIPHICRKSHWHVTVTVAELEGYTSLIAVEPGDATAYQYGVAVDIGTTTVVAYLIDLTTGQVLATASNYNGQVPYGENILTRIQYADTTSGTAVLQQAIVTTLNELMSQLAASQKISTQLISAVSIAGNTAMVHLLLDLNPIQICKEPYTPIINSPDYISASQLNLQINPYGVVYIVPSIGSYVGGDVIAGVLVSEMHKNEEVSLLVDIGTNGEIILGNSQWLVACAGAAGPALEGGVVKYGMRAEPGAIDSVNIHPKTKKITYTTIDNEKPKGLCGSGLVDFLAQVLLNGMVDRSGKFKDGADYFKLVDKAFTATGEDILIWQQDLKNLIRTKGAVSASLGVLLESVGCPLSEITYFYAAGAFGNYINSESAVTIGLYPDLPRDRIIRIGNSSGEGARLALISKDKRQELKSIAKKITYFEMNANQTFMDKFTSGLFLPDSNLDAYPSIKTKLINMGIIKNENPSYR